MFIFERIDPVAEAQELIDFMTVQPWPYPTGLCTTRWGGLVLCVSKT